MLMFFTFLMVSTIRQRLADVSSLHKHLVGQDHAGRNPVVDVERPVIDRDEGSTLAFSRRRRARCFTRRAEDTIAGTTGDPISLLAGRLGARRDRRAQPMDPDVRIARKHVGALGNRGYSAHSMRATFITTALKNGAQLEHMKKSRRASRPEHYKAVRPARGYNPEKATNFLRPTSRTHSAAGTRWRPSTGH